MAQALPDIIKPDLKVLFIGFNPSLSSAARGHHYAGRSNGFWRLLWQAGFTPRQLLPEEDGEMLQWGYGLTNIVHRPTRTAAEITAAEYHRGRERLLCFLLRYQPHWAAYVGAGVYREFSRKRQAGYGLQPESHVKGIKEYVLPSTSGLNRMPRPLQLEWWQGLEALVAADCN